MINYSKQDIIDELLIISSKPKTREPHIIDKRNYLIAILYYKFNLPEELIFSHTNLTSRSSINYAKRKVYELYAVNDKLFFKNVDELINKYPCNFNDFDIVTGKYTRNQLTPIKSVISIELSKKSLKKLSNFMIAKKISNPEEAAKKLILSVLKLWEE
jgi:hypothetical protein